jgi:hypothetical protein
MTCHFAMKRIQAGCYKRLIIPLYTCALLSLITPRANPHGVLLWEASPSASVRIRLGIGSGGLVNYPPPSDPTPVLIASFTHQKRSKILHSKVNHVRNSTSRTCITRWEYIVRRESKHAPLAAHSRQLRSRNLLLPPADALAFPIYVEKGSPSALLLDAA